MDPPVRPGQWVQSGPWVQPAPLVLRVPRVVRDRKVFLAPPDPRVLPALKVCRALLDLPVPLELPVLKDHRV